MKMKELEAIRKGKKPFYMKKCTLSTSNVYW